MRYSTPYTSTFGNPFAIVDGHHTLKMKILTLPPHKVSCKLRRRLLQCDKAAPVAF